MTRRSLYPALTLAALFLVVLTAVARMEPPATVQPVDKIILITVDALRADRLGCYGYRGAPTSPNIDSFAEHAALFERAYSQAPWTVPSMGSLMSGHYVRDAGAYTNSGDIVPSISTLAERLQHLGFRTGFFNSSPFLAKPGIARGFDSVAPVTVGEKIPYTSVEPLVMAWLDRHAQEKFFLWIHDMDTHEPATDGNPFLSRPGWGSYDAEVRWVDEAMGRLFAKLRALGIRDHALIVFTADHGEAFGEHGLQGHQDVIYQEALHVPLIVALPGMEQGSRFAQAVQLLDMNPTIFEIAGGERGEAAAGESLVPIIEAKSNHVRHPYVFSARYYFDSERSDEKTGKQLCARNQHQLAVHSDRWALIAKVPAAAADSAARPVWDTKRPATYELYDLQSDPLELHDVYDSRSTVAAEMQHALFEWQRSGDSEQRDNQPNLTASQHEAMRALGYAND